MHDIPISDSRGISLRFTIVPCSDSPDSSESPDSSDSPESSSSPDSPDSESSPDSPDSSESSDSMILNRRINNEILLINKKKKKEKSRSLGLLSLLTDKRTMIEISNKDLLS